MNKPFFSKLTKFFDNLSLNYNIFCIYIIALCFSFLTSAIMNKLYPNIINDDIKSLIFYSLLSITTLFFIIYFFNQRQEPFKFNAFLFIFIYLLSMFVVEIFIVSIWNIASFSILFGVFLFYILTLVLPMIYIYKMLSYSLKDKIYAIIIGIVIYLTIIFDGSFLVFAYYTSMNYIDSSFMYNFNHANSFVGMLKILLEVSVGKFYNYDSSFNTPSSFKIPYIIGKLLDSFLLAFIFSKMVSGKPKVKIEADFLKKINMLEKENKTLNDQLSKKKNIIKKLRKDIERLNP